MCLSHPECQACAQPDADLANRAYEVLENNRTLLINTNTKYRMLDTAASAASRGHPAAGAAYTIQQARDIYPAREKFMDNLTKANRRAQPPRDESAQDRCVWDSVPWGEHLPSYLPEHDRNHEGEILAMNKLIVPSILLSVFGLALAACGRADEGSREAAVEISLTSPIDPSRCDRS